MKKGFTLVELLIVMGIIAVLSGVLIVSMGGGSEAARAANCLTNLRSLANGAIAYASASEYYPCAGSVVKSYIDESRGIGKGQTIYREVPGWLSWCSEGMFPSTSQKSPETLCTYLSSSQVSPEDQKLRDFSITNGTLKATLSGNRDLLLCPLHKIDMKDRAPYFSYVMNEYFYWNSTEKPRNEHFHGRLAKNISHADRRLLFAEIQWKDYAGQAYDSTSGTDTDPVLQYSRGECIGFNHKKGRDKVAHVAFADGHTEQILLPKGGIGDADLKELTKLLCEAKDVSFDNGKYREMK